MGAGTSISKLSLGVLFATTPVAKLAASLFPQVITCEFEMLIRYLHGR